MISENCTESTSTPLTEREANKRGLDQSNQAQNHQAIERIITRSRNSVSSDMTKTTEVNY